MSQAHSEDFHQKNWRCTYGLSSVYDQLIQPDFLLLCQLSVLTGNSGCETLSLGAFWTLRLRVCVPRAKWIEMASWFMDTALVSWLPVDEDFQISEIFNDETEKNAEFYNCQLQHSYWHNFTRFMRRVNNYTKQFFIAWCWKNDLILGQGGKYIGTFPVRKKSFTNATESLNNF